MMKRSWISWVIMAVVLIVAAILLNPSAERHREKIRSALSERSQVNAMLAVGALTAFVSSYHTLGVASYTTIGGKTVSIGAFGAVFVFD